MKQFISIFVAGSLFISSAANADLQIVKDGKLANEIALPLHPTAPQQFAAKEFSRYIEMMTGAKLPIRPDENSSALRFDSPEQAYQILDQLGCLFLAPEYDFYKGSAEIVPAHLSNLALPDKPTSPPKLKLRKLYVEEGRSHTIDNLKQMVEWMPKVGYNTLVVPTNYQGHGKVKWDNWRDALTPELQKRGITIEVGGHGYQNFLNADMEDGKLFDQHPEWFGQDKTGKRRREENFVLCTSNTAAVNYLIDHFIEYIKAHPEIQVYDFWPPDGAHWCECDQCAMLGSPSDRQAILLKQVADRAHQIRRDLRLEMIAYNSVVAPPENKTIDKNVLVDFCPINQQFDHQIDDPAAQTNATYVSQLKDWRSKFTGDINIYSYYRKYAWDSLPVELPHYLQKDLQFYASLPVQGVSTYCEPGDWATYELNHYTLAALARDPNADVDAIEKKFCDARYGPAGGDAIIAINALEQVVRNDCALPNSSLKGAAEIDKAIWSLHDPSEQIDIDLSAVQDDPHKQALSRLQLLLQYAQRDLMIQKLRAANAAEDDIKKQIESLQSWLADHQNDGVFLVSDQRASIQRMSGRYGIHDTKGQ